MQSAAEVLTREFGDKVSQALPHDSRASQLSRLPGNCPNCGAPVRTREVDWVEESIVECAYCGTPLRPLA